MLEKFTCHKEVEAFEIGRIDGNKLYPKDEVDFCVEVSAEYLLMHPLNQPGYYVRYDNGHQSFSPKDVFERGYKKGGRRQIIHVVLGSENYDPSIRDMQAVQAMFESAYLDPLGATIVTRHDIDSTVEFVEELAEVRFVKVSIKGKTPKQPRKNWLPRRGE